jgi:hypothetical protein
LFDTAMRARFKARDRERRDLAWLALNVAILPRLKQLPTIDELVGKVGVQPGARQQTPDQLQFVMRQWSVAQGMALADRQRLLG